METIEAQTLVSTREASKLLGVAVRTVQLWVESGVLPAWKTAGGHRRIARSAVEQLLAQRQEAVSRPVNGDLAHQPAKACTIVLVDDDPNFVVLFRAVVQHWDFPVKLVTASDGFVGLMRIGQCQPDLIVTDLNMPGMDGFQMVRSLEKTQTGLKASRVIAVSALSPDDVERRGGLPAEVVYFQKPVPFAELQAMAREVYLAAAPR